MKKLNFLFLLLFVCVGAKAEDQLKGDTLIRTLSVGNASLLFFVNPTGMTEQTMVFCMPSEESSEAVLSDSNMGGVFMVTGSTLLVKNDKSHRFNDGSQLKGDYVQIECK